MIDLNLLRECPQVFVDSQRLRCHGKKKEEDKGNRTRSVRKGDEEEDGDIVARLIVADETWKRAVYCLQNHRREQNQISKDVKKALQKTKKMKKGSAKTSVDPELKRRIKHLKAEVKKILQNVERALCERDALYAQVGNIVSGRVPIGYRDSVLRYFGRDEKMSSLERSRNNRDDKASDRKESDTCSKANTIDRDRRHLIDAARLFAADYASKGGFSTRTSASLSSKMSPSSESTVKIENQWILESDLPRRLSKASDTDGVALFCVCNPTASRAMLLSLLRDSIQFYQALGVKRGRVVSTAARRLALDSCEEFVVQGYCGGRFLPLAVVSNTSDYMARRLECRCGSKTKERGLTWRSRKYCHIVRCRLVESRFDENLLTCLLDEKTLSAELRDRAFSGGSASPSDSTQIESHQKRPGGAPKRSAVVEAPPCYGLEYPTDETCEKFERWLTDYSYLTGFHLTSRDAVFFRYFGKDKPRSCFRAIGRWYRHISSYSDEERASLPNAPN